MKKRVLLGMSGGIDSSVSAMILQEKGFEVVGISFLFYNDKQHEYDPFSDAKNLASQLNIKHITADLREEFREKIIHYFLKEYQVGNTPFPCAKCNPSMKFSALERYADLENCDFIATGHYARVMKFGGKKYIYKGVDPDKDQSFFLWGLNENLLKRLIFPLGDFKKPEARNFADKRGFNTLSQKKDSLGICFTGGDDYRDFLLAEGIFSEPGHFVNQQGRILGMHRGITNYTIGQRHGLGINVNKRLFVAEIRPDANEIVLADYDHLYKNKLRLKDTYFVDKEEINPQNEYHVKVRYRLQLTPCKLNIFPNARAEVSLLKSEAMIAPGQTAVFYDGDRVIGGGFIESVE